METLRQYIFSVTAAALICSVLTHISAGAGKTNGMIKLLCGLYLSFTVIRPIADIRIGQWWDYSLGIHQDAREAIAEGEDFAKDSMASIIKESTEAYILDKASELDARITADVILNDDMIPAEVYIKGKISPYGKKRLQQIISEDIGIAKEYQIWIQ